MQLKKGLNIEKPIKELQYGEVAVVVDGVMSKNFISIAGEIVIKIDEDKYAVIGKFFGPEDTGHRQVLLACETTTVRVLEPGTELVI